MILLQQLMNYTSSTKQLLQYYLNHFKNVNGWKIVFFLNSFQVLMEVKFGVISTSINLTPDIKFRMFFVSRVVQLTV